MSIETTETVVQGVLVLGIRTARLDAANSPDFRIALMEQVDKGQGQIVIDLGQVEFMDSSALGALISAVKRMGAVGAIALARPNANLTRLLTLTRMDKVFAITATIDEAVEKLAA